MANLTAQQRQDCYRDFVERLMKTTETIGITKSELLDAVNATDDWIEANALVFNSALPLLARTSLSAKQKALLFMAVAAKRFGVL